MITIQGICYDDKSSFMRGAAGAPPLIRERLWSSAYNYYSESGVEIQPSIINDRGDFNIDTYWDIYSISSENLKAENQMLTLGGDHSITYPVVKAISERIGEFDILHIDAHGDLYDEFEGDKFSHACPFARIMEDGLTNRLVQIGIRTLTNHQRKQADRYGVEIIEMKDIERVVGLSFDNPIYLSLDIDAFDPAFAPGVSHQESGGLSVREVLRVLANIKVPVIGADIVEFNPLRDVAGITAALCAKMSKEILAKMIAS